MSDLITYIFSCVAMGLGIGMDVVVATIARWPSLKDYKDKSFWIKGVTLTHAFFPMIGYFVFIALFSKFPPLKPLLGVTGFSLIAYFLVTAVKSWLSNTHDNYQITLGAIIAVSLDALYSGPGKSAQAISWTSHEIVISFFISAFTVTLLALTTLLSLSYINSKILKRQASIITTLQFTEFTVISYFGYLSLLRLTFDVSSMFLSVIFSLATSVVVFFFIAKKLLSINSIGNKGTFD